MFRAPPSRSRTLRSAEAPGRTAPARPVESSPPQASAPRAWSTRLSDWLGVSGWRVSRTDFASSFGQRGRLDALAAARLDFADALFDVHTGRGRRRARPDRGDALACTSCGTCAAKCSTWSRCVHDQAAAACRLQDLDRHFAKRSPLARWRDASSAGASARALTAQAAAPACGSAPRKSILPSSTPLWRSSAYVVVTWKKKFGSAKCLRYASPDMVIGPARRGTEMSFASLPMICAAGTDFR
jgi:hypothetical protein